VPPTLPTQALDDDVEDEEGTNFLRAFATLYKYLFDIQ
jgi:hypothetical protein